MICSGHNNVFIAVREVWGIWVPFPLIHSYIEGDHAKIGVGKSIGIGRSGLEYFLFLWISSVTLDKPLKVSEFHFPHVQNDDNLSASRELDQFNS